MWSSFWALPLALGGALAYGDPKHFEDGSDLENFVSRPEIKAPRMMVSKHIPERISDGYWFTTPYSNFAGQPKTPRREFHPCQTGAHIYDGDGNLVWGGACWGGNRNIFGFKPVTIDGKQYLKMYLSAQVIGEIQPDDKKQSGVTLDNTYKEVNRVMLHGSETLDFHEFNIMEDGKTALVTTQQNERKDVPELGQKARRITNMGFQEVMLDSGSPTFTWNPLEHGVLLNESFDEAGRKHSSDYWDFLHINAVDKNKDGDYLVSGRHTSTVYKVSGEDGHVIWRLGGYDSDFVMEDGLIFYWQHHARFQFENETTTIISLFDNAADDHNRNPSIKPTRSSGKIIALDTSATPMTARVLRRFDRPDGASSPKLGSLQILGDSIEKDNVFMDWAIQGYISEHDADGNCVLEARFHTDRMMSYRAYKFSFVGMPTEPPALKVLPTTFFNDKLSSAFYVSWNGATEVAAWNFYGSAQLNGTYRLIGSANKTGFETSWIWPGLVTYSYAEAVDKVGKALSQSAVQSIDPPRDGSYQAIYPLLETQDTKADANLDFKVLPLESQDQDGTMTRDVQWISVIVIDGFALWGLYSIIRIFIPRKLSGENLATPPMGPSPIV